MATETIERPRVGGPGHRVAEGAWRVIVLNDNHNTFDHVAATLARVIPSVTLDAATASPTRSTTPARQSSGPVSASRRSTTGSSSSDAGLTMAPLEQG